MRAFYPLDTIEYVLHGGMKNIITAILSENLDPTITMKRTAPATNGVSAWLVKAKVRYENQLLTLTAVVPVRHPDLTIPWFRIDADGLVKIEVDGDRQPFVFEAWCECDDMLGLDIHKVIVRKTHPLHGFEWWMVTEASRVRYRGAYDNLPLQTKELVAEKWSHLPHVCINTEKRAMDYIRFRSRGTQ